MWSKGKVCIFQKLGYVSEYFQNPLLSIPIRHYCLWETNKVAVFNTTGMRMGWPFNVQLHTNFKLETKKVSLTTFCLLVFFPQLCVVEPISSKLSLCLFQLWLRIKTVERKQSSHRFLTVLWISHLVRGKEAMAQPSSTWAPGWNTLIFT